VQAAKLQEEAPAPPKAPTQAIVQGLVLLIGGLCVLSYGFLHLLGHVVSKDGAVRPVFGLLWAYFTGASAAPCHNQQVTSSASYSRAGASQSWVR
jgi:hypothetical protein